MKTNLFLTRVQRYLSLALAIFFYVICVAYKDEIGISRNPAVQIIVIGLSILIGLVWIIVDSFLSAEIESIKDELKEARSNNEDVKQVL